MARTAFASVRAMSDSRSGTTPKTPHATAHPRFAEALTELGLTVEVRGFPEATRTAVEAAAAVGCELAQIVKSLVFAVDGQPVLVLMDGASRVDPERVRTELGAAEVARADAALVRETTGYAIGGVPPFGHRTRTRVLADRGLLAHDTVWAAAGTPHTVFPLAPAALIEYAGGRVVDVRQRTA
ncbi:Cys-tRNA(Pro) deacylase, prolyl-tRNA editing enzyme YbaK/EbsC [Streptomyces sp. 2224.1]|nr:prolyl-tRNA editing enzyme YbaK/EbsC (Cys-tRNA(Pro) deacylase) [Streptomyces sp. 2321.6]SDR46359.1 Cys-tRNA(Pro) deacylase, prolyl-tRNA editing enzyme YbaK/EbsC [Streptomyces sp. KS_16]SEC28290.1 Cys-tRNA(Pro) deacylase, prolyl-tRNA editing enzyme YbaK/EbsC [Streptomyces sp. 2224.1]SEC76304.1 Cys-tRNA(Pro) deacylase, prolyl-tRNA editing enzyme YbaK/EbsC [Streptomyces sp. 2133.1]SNC68982.1 Cys-tRNA(Pro) deacylase, prolyl-tRNA editing enzyme YbaK/EbsC [Streptomyces sp. 2114.4]